MQYREFAVPDSLGRHIRCVWRLHDATPSRDVQVIYPDGCCELIAHLGEPMAAYSAIRGWIGQPACLFAAQQRSAIRLKANAPVACVGVRLQPAAAAAIAGQRLSSLRDQIVDLRELDATLASKLGRVLATFDSDPADAGIWELLAAAVAGFQIDRRIEAAAGALESDHGLGRMAVLAADSAMSVRSFQIRFLAQVGLGAKEFARVLRLQATLRQLDGGGATLAEVAADRGFSDQAHATREIRELTGLTPARLARALHNERESENTIELAAAFVRGHHTKSPAMTKRAKVGCQTDGRLVDGA